jgi:beta-N-acetylhexosaminidase
MALGMGANNVELTERSYEGLARELKLLGIDWVFAPVADVNSDTKNPVIGVRSFGTDASEVAKHVGAAVRGIQKSGVAACLKHFPGHGGTHVDSHLDRPVVRDKGLNELEEVELVPFREGLKNGAGSVMTGHLVLTEFGDEVCSLERKIITGLLREKVGFEEVIVTDCLEMDAVSETDKGGCGVPEACVRALAGGTDVAMICHRMDRQVGGIEAVWDAVRSERIKIDALKQSGKRVKQMKERFASLAAVTEAEWEQTWVETKRRHEILSSEAYSKTVKVLRPQAQVGREEKVTLYTPAIESLNRAVDDSEEVERNREGKVRNTAGGSYGALGSELKLEKHVVYSSGRDVSPGDIAESGRVVFVLRNADRADWQLKALKQVEKAVGRDRMVVVSSCNPFDGSGVDIQTFEFTREGLLQIVQREE